MRVLLVSNGHGEDVIARAVGAELRANGMQVAAVPLVGEGHAYDAAGIEAHGPRRALPSGGYTLHGVRHLWDDVRAGLAPVTWGAWRAVRRAAKDATACLIVGDSYALMVSTYAATARRYYLPSAMSVRAWPSSAPAWKRPFGPVEQRLMRRCVAVYPRDDETASWLRRRGHRNVRSLGNPMLDALDGDAPLSVPPPYLVLLPGTRGDARQSLPLMLEACRHLRGLRLRPVIAWAATGPPPELHGWRWRDNGCEWGVAGSFRHEDGSEVALARGAFATLLRGARGGLSTSGTAAEQFAGHGVPLTSFVTGGPQYTEAFAAAQKRTLGRALDLAPPEPRTVACRMRAFLADRSRRRAARRDGAAAMGAPGAARRIGADVTQELGVDHRWTAHFPRREPSGEEAT